MTYKEGHRGGGLWRRQWQTMQRTRWSFLCIVLLSMLASASAQPLRISVFAAAGEVNKYMLTPEGREKAAAIFNSFKVSKIFLEGRRGDQYVPPAVLREIRDDFRKRGFLVSGGIMYSAGKNWAVKTSARGGWLNFQAEKTQRDVAQYFTENAAVFDELLVDDMFGTDDASPESDRARGSRSWSEYRRDLLATVIEPLMLKSARAVNPSVRLIIKYPQWYDWFHMMGYDPPRMSGLSDQTWVGTETRNPLTASMGFVQPTEGYINYRWFSSIAGKKVAGAWFDHGDCTAQNYVDQAYQSVLAGSPELTVWSIETMMEGSHPGDPLLQKALPELFELADKVHGRSIRGISYYKPAGSDGDGNLYLMDYLAMIGLPIVPEASYPAASRIAILGAQAASDPEVLAHMKQHLSRGATLVLTPDLLHRLGKAATEMAGVHVLGQTRIGTADGVEIKGQQVSLTTPLEMDLGLEAPAGEVLISASSGDNRVPLLTSHKVGSGRILVLNVRTFSWGDGRGTWLLAPKELGLQEIPQALADALRRELLAPLDIQLSSPTKVSFYVWGDASVFYNFRDETVELVLNQKPVTLGPHRALWR
jgi:hypothetical protein